MNQPKFRKIAHALTYVLLVVVILVVVQAIGSPQRDAVKELNYSEVLQLIEDDKLAYVMMSGDRKSTRLNSSHIATSRMPSSA